MPMNCIKEMSSRVKETLKPRVSPCFSLCTLALVAAGALASFSASAQPRYTPSDASVVLPVSVHAQGSQAGSLRALDSAWRRNPQDQQAALAYARAVFLIGLTEGDLRWFGSAKAALAPWWNSAQLPAEGHFLRGLVKQGFHAFDDGLKDIDMAIALERKRPEFWSWRFALHLLLADIPAARKDCTEIGNLFGRDEAKGCTAILAYRTGQAAQAVELLKAAVVLPGFQDPLSQDWLRFHLGEALRTAGRYAEAVALWEQHLKARPQSHLVRLALVELLNLQGQPAKAKKYASTAAPTDALLVQALLASRALQDGDTARLADLFEGRMSSQALRQETLIERPKLIYLIRYGKDPAAGLQLSVANWKIQNEPPDALLFVEAAILQKQPRAAAPVVAWAEKTAYADPQLTPLLQKLKSLPGWQAGAEK